MYSNRSSKNESFVVMSLPGCLNARNSGFSVDGTFSQYVVSWVTHVTPIPDNLSSAEAASILCAVRLCLLRVRSGEVDNGIE